MSYLSDLTVELREPIVGVTLSSGHRIGLVRKGWEYRDGSPNKVWTAIVISIDGRPQHEVNLGSAQLNTLLQLYVNPEQAEWLCRAVSERFEVERPRVPVPPAQVDYAAEIASQMAECC